MQEPKAVSSGVKPVRSTWWRPTRTTKTRAMKQRFYETQVVRPGWSNGIEKLVRGLGVPPKRFGGFWYVDFAAVLDGFAGLQRIEQLRVPQHAPRGVSTGSSALTCGPRATGATTTHPQRRAELRRRHGRRPASHMMRSPPGLFPLLGSRSRNSVRSALRGSRRLQTRGFGIQVSAFRS